MTQAQLKTLIIGPDGAIDETIGRALRQLNALRISANGDDQIVESIDSNEPDLLIFSNRIPLKLGVRLCRQIRKFRTLNGLPHIPILFLLSSRGVSPRLDALRAGADLVLQKPYHAEEVVLHLGNLLEMKQRIPEPDRGHNEDHRFLDPGTNFYNRPYLLKRLQEEFKRVQRFQEPLSCIVAEIDSFETLEQRQGRFEKRNILNTVAGVLSRTSRGNNVLAHIAEGRFCFLLPNTAVSGAIAYADRMRESIQARFQTMTRFEPPITISLGVSSYPHNNVSEPEQLLALAENALGRARKMGRNRYFLCSKKSNLEFITSNLRWRSAQVSSAGDQPSRRSTVWPQLREQQLINSVTSLLRALDLKDPGSRHHARQTAIYSLEIGRRILSTPQSIRVLKYAALLHDVGKIGIKDEILQKDTSLDEEERHLMKSHVELSVQITKPLSLPDEVSRFIFHHHENFNGSGYPYGIQGDEIPVGARILAVADSFDAITSSRVYSSTNSAQEAAAELEQFSGIQFDPVILAVILHDLEGIMSLSEDKAFDEGDSFEETFLKRTDYPLPKSIKNKQRYSLLKPPKP